MPHDRWTSAPARPGAPGRAGHLALRTVVILAAALVAAACTSRGTQVGAMTAPAMVEVDNRAFLDANVFVLRSGQRIRLGTATGSSRTTFTLPRGLVSSATQLSFLIDFVGSSRSPISEEITVLPGDTVMLMVPPQ
jgi:hypothetical protein